MHKRVRNCARFAGWGGRTGEEHFSVLLEGVEALQKLVGKEPKRGSLRRSFPDRVNKEHRIATFAEIVSFLNSLERTQSDVFIA